MLENTVSDLINSVYSITCSTFSYRILFRDLLVAKTLISEIKMKDALVCHENYIQMRDQYVVISS